MKRLIYSIFFLTFLKTIPTTAAEKIFHIQLSNISDRLLFGGLGTSDKSVGSITEFMADDSERTPLISLPGKHADQFNSKNVFIFKNSNLLSGSTYFICPEDTFNKKCLDCGTDCQQPDSVKKLKKYHNLTLSHSKMKLIKEMNFSAQIDQGQNNILEFQFPVKGHNPISLLAKKARTDTFKSVVSILQNMDENYFLICPKSQFSPECLVCLDCIGKLQQIQNYLPIK